MQLKSVLPQTGFSPLYINQIVLMIISNYMFLARNNNSVATLLLGTLDLTTWVKTWDFVFLSERFCAH